VSGGGRNRSNSSWRDGRGQRRSDGHSDNGGPRGGKQGGKPGQVAAPLQGSLLRSAPLLGGGLLAAARNGRWYGVSPNLSGRGRNRCFADSCDLNNWITANKIALQQVGWELRGCDFSKIFTSRFASNTKHDRTQSTQPTPASRKATHLLENCTVREIIKLHVYALSSASNSFFSWRSTCLNRTTG